MITNTSSRSPSPPPPPSPASHTGNVRRGTEAEADADVDTTPLNVNVNVNVHVNVNVNTRTNTNTDADTDINTDTHTHQVPEPGTPPRTTAEPPRTPTDSRAEDKQYIEVQNTKKTIIFQNLLRRSEGVIQGRALASKHGIPQASQNRRHGVVELYRLLTAHTECTDFCLISASDGALHGIEGATLFTAKELRVKCAVLSPKVTAKAKVAKRKAANRLENVSKRSRTSGTSANAADPANWPEPMSWSQKKGLVTDFFKTLQAVQKPYTTCDFCGTECLVDDAKSFAADVLDISILEEAVEHARKTLNQPRIIPHQGDKDILNVCPACSTSIKGNAFTTVPLFSYANACWVGDQPDQLKDLSYFEQIAIARARGTRCFIKLEKGPLGQSAAVGNVCVLPQEPKHLSNILPPPINELVDEIAVVFVSDASADVKNETLLKSPLLLRRGRVLAALKWLQENNPLYKDIEISEVVAEQYPEHGALPAPTQHMLPVAGLSGEGASYTSYSGQANIEAFEGNDGPIPIIAQGMMDLDTVGDTYHERKLQAILRLKQGLDPFIKYPSGSTPLSTSYSPKTWAYLWPALFPYGVGAFEDPVRLDTSFGLRKLHFKTHVKRLLFLTDRRFCTHPSFVFVVMNVMQRRASSFSATLATKRTWFGSVQNDLSSLSVDVVGALQTKLEKDPAYRPVSDEEKICFRLIKRLQFLSQPVSGSTGEIALYREEIRAACRVYGLPHLYVTINPADSHHPIAQIFTGRSVELTPENKLVDAAEKQVRAKMVAANPVAGARFFNFLMTTFFDVLIGDGTKEGIFGSATDHYGIVEAQDRGSLHCHMFVWLKDGLSPLQIQAKAQQDAEWSKKYLAWLEDIIKLDFVPENLTTDTEMIAQPTVPPTPTFVVGPTPTEDDFDDTWPTYVNNVLRRTGQNHEHGFTCYKHLPKSLRALRDADKDCRFRLPRPIVKESTFDDDGHVEMKCTNGMMNGYNDIVAGTMACNMDCKSIGSGTAALAMITYVTNYISKMGLDSGLVMSALSGSMKAMEKQKQSSESDPDVVEESEVQDSATARMVLLKTVNQMIGKRKLSGQQVAAFLCGFPNRYTRGRFEKMFWGPMLRTVLAEFYRASTSEPTEPNSEGTDAVLEGLVVVQESSDMPGYSSLCSPLAEDYKDEHGARPGIGFPEFSRIP